MTSINDMNYNQFSSNQGWINFSYPSNIQHLEINITLMRNWYGYIKKE